MKRTAKVKRAVKRRPTGTTASIATLLVIIAAKAGLELSEAEAAGIVGGISALVSIVYTPPE